MVRSWCERKRSRALVREISPNFTKALASYFGTGPTDVEKSRLAHRNYVTALQENGVVVDVLPALAEKPDCTFVEDVAVVIDDIVVIPHMGHPSREGEQAAVRDFLATKLEVFQMPEGAKMDGGDVIFFDDCFLVGHSTRTNMAGIEFFSGVAMTKGYPTVIIDVPKSTLHLTTVCSSPKPGVLVAAEGHLTPEQFVQLIIEGVDILWIPNEESYAANVIGFESGDVLISSGYPKTKQILEGAGFTTHSIEMEHIRAADGSLTCCSVFYE